MDLDRLQELAGIEPKSPKSPKIRWYDYVFALVAADIILSFLIMGFNSTTWWEPLLYGGVAGYLARTWDDVYCNFRLRQEINRG
jgi:hypothetical protein